MQTHIAKKCKRNCFRCSVSRPVGYQCVLVHKSIRRKSACRSLPHRFLLVEGPPRCGKTELAYAFQRQGTCLWNGFSVAPELRRKRPSGDSTKV